MLVSNLFWRDMTRKVARIVGLGKYLPKKVLTNQQLETMVATSDEWIVSRTGIKERRVASMEEHTSFLGTEAAKLALEDAKVSPDQIEMIICATMTPDYITPSTAAVIQKELHIPPGAAAYDLQAACTGLLYAVMQAKALVEAGVYTYVLVVATEKMSTVIDYEDRNTCVLFGDGAAACVISSVGKGFLINTISVGADGEQCKLIYIPAGGARQPATEASVKAREHFVKMEGREVFKHAVRRMAGSIKECLEKSGLRETDLAWLIPHQANKRIIDALADQFKIPSERIFMTLHKYGNTSGSSVGIALTELCEEKKIHPGDHLLLVAFGAGLTWGAAILTKEGE